MSIHIFIFSRIYQLVDLQDGLQVTFTTKTSYFKIRLEMHFQAILL